MHSKTMKTPLKEKKINLESKGLFGLFTMVFLYNYKVRAFSIFHNSFFVIKMSTKEHFGILIKYKKIIKN